MASAGAWVTFTNRNGQPGRVLFPDAERAWAYAAERAAYGPALVELIR